MRAIMPWFDSEVCEMWNRLKTWRKLRQLTELFYLKSNKSKREETYNNKVKNMPLLFVTNLFPLNEQPALMHL